MSTLSDKTAFARSLYNIGAIKFGQFTLKSGKKSPFYIDLRILSSYPRVLQMAGFLLGAVIAKAENKPDVLCGIPFAGLAIANAVSFQYEIPAIYTKKEPVIYKDLVTYLQKIESESTDVQKPGLQKAIEVIDSLSGMKTHGLARYVDGNLEDNAKVAIVDDLITTADSKLESVELIKLEAEKRNIHVCVAGIFVLLDREQGGQEALKKQGLSLHSVFSIREIANLLLKDNLLSKEMHDIIIKYTIEDRKQAGLS
jgi:orotate phosphoribosyltransferase